VRFLNATKNRLGHLRGGNHGNVLKRSFTSGRFSCCLLCASHYLWCDTLVDFWKFEKKKSAITLYAKNHQGVQINLIRKCIGTTSTIQLAMTQVFNINIRLQSNNTILNPLQQNWISALQCCTEVF